MHYISATPLHTHPLNNSETNDEGPGNTQVTMLMMATLAAAAASPPTADFLENPDNPEGDLAEPMHREISMSTDSSLASVSDITSASSCSSPSGGGSHHSAGTSTEDESRNSSSSNSGKSF